MAFQHLDASFLSSSSYAFAREVMQRLYTHSLMQTLMAGIVLYGSSLCKIHLTPVPVSMISLGFLWVGMSCRPQQALGALMTYLSLNFLYQPTFVLMGVTAGYVLAGMLVALALSLWSKQALHKKQTGKKAILPSYQHSFASLCVISFVGHLMIHAGGLIGLVILGDLSWKQALMVGSLPFWFGDFFCKTFVLAKWFESKHIS